VRRPGRRRLNELDRYRVEFGSEDCPGDRESLPSGMALRCHARCPNECGPGLRM
jgi:hypothetical protein